MIGDDEFEAVLAALSDDLLAACLKHARHEHLDDAGIAARVGLDAAQIVEVRRSVKVDTLLILGMIRRIRGHQRRELRS